MTHKITKGNRKAILSIYDELMERFGPQGWWPVSCEVEGAGYHPNSFTEPQTATGRFEICIGAILTQNTAWKNVEKALQSLSLQGYLDPQKILTVDELELQAMIRPAGYYVQKARYLRNIAEWFLQNDELQLLNCDLKHRDVLLHCKGVGPETADSILLYAYNMPTFVVDAYTRRIFEARKVFSASLPYEAIQALFLAALPQDIKVYQEYHALIVAEAKRVATRIKA